MADLRQWQVVAQSVELRLHFAEERVEEPLVALRVGGFFVVGAEAEECEGRRRAPPKRRRGGAPVDDSRPRRRVEREAAAEAVGQRREKGNKQELAHGAAGGRPRQPGCRRVGEDAALMGTTSRTSPVPYN